MKKNEFNILFEKYTGIGFPRDTKALHVHEYSELSLLECGDITYVTDNLVKHVVGKSIIFSHANQYHNPYVNDSEYNHYQVMFDAQFLYDFMMNHIDCFQSLSDSNIISITDKQYDDLAHDFLSLRDRLSQPDSKQNDLLKRLILSTILIKYAMLVTYDSKKPVFENNSYIEEIMRYIQNNYNEKLTIQHITSKFFISRTKFITDFENLTGMTPNSFITITKLEKAKEFLLNGYSVEKTSEECGFVSPSYFIQTFKKYNKMTPLSYMRQYSPGKTQASTQTGLLKKKIQYQGLISDYKQL